MATKNITGVILSNELINSGTNKKGKAWDLHQIKIEGCDLRITTFDEKIQTGFKRGDYVEAKLVSKGEHWDLLDMSLLNSAAAQEDMQSKTPKKEEFPIEKIRTAQEIQEDVKRENVLGEINILTEECFKLQCCKVAVKISTDVIGMFEKADKIADYCKKA